MNTTRKVRGGLPVSFRYTPGVGNTAFFEALRDRGVLLGSRCSSCDVVYLPARIFCERCMAALDAGPECGPAGTLESWTVGYVGIDGEPLEQPRSVGLVKVDGADTVLLHHLLGDGPWEIGQRVAVELIPQAQRSASILDIAGFRPA